MHYSDLPGRIKNPDTDSRTPQAPKRFRDPAYAYPAQGHRSHLFNPEDSYFWGTIWYFQRMNQHRPENVGSGPKGAWNFNDCSWEYLIGGAVRYNGGGDPVYEEKIINALRESGCRK
jgi:hypothetical protein